MRSIVTGAAGFIGSHLVRALADHGDVVAVDSFTTYYERDHKLANLQRFADLPSVTFLEGDLRSVLTNDVLEGTDVVFHQAGQPGVRASWATGFGEYVDLNIVVTQWLLEAMLAAGVPRMVMASSSSVYGNAERYPVTEADLPQPFSPYGVTKLAAERLALAYHQNFGLELAALRYFTVYGPSQRPDMAMHRLIRAAIDGTAFPLYGDGSQIRDFTFVADAVSANVLAATARLDAAAIVNICGGSQASLRSVIDMVEGLVGRSVQLQPMGSQAGDVYRTGGVNDQARELLGWNPSIELSDGLAAHVAHTLASV